MRIGCGSWLLMIPILIFVAFNADIYNQDMTQLESEEFMQTLCTILLVPGAACFIYGLCLWKARQKSG
jgi:hypothetical protein